MLPQPFLEENRSLQLSGNSILNFMPDNLKIGLKEGLYKIGTRCLYFYEKDNTLLITHTGSSKIHLLNLSTGKLREFSHHTKTVRKVLVHNNEIITASWDCTIRIIDYYTLKERLCLTDYNMGRSPHVFVSADGEFVYAFCYDSDHDPMCNHNNVRKWRLKNGELIGVISNTGAHIESLNSGLSKEYNNKLYVVSDSGLLCVFKASSLKLIYSSFLEKNLRCFCFYPEKNAILASALTGSVYWFDLKSKKVIRTIKCHNRDITVIRFVPGKKDYLATSSFDGTLKIWKMPEFTCESTISNGMNSLWSMAFRKNMMFIGGVEGDIWIYDIQNLPDYELKARIKVFDDSYAIFPVESRMFYTDNLKNFEIVDSTGKEKIDEKQSEYYLRSLNTFKVMQDLFGDQDYLKKYLESTTSIRLQIPQYITP